MPEPQKNQSVTIQTRLPQDISAEITAVLDAYAEFFSGCERKFVAGIQKGSVPKKNDFIREHGLTARQFNALRQSAEGKIQSQKSNLPNYIYQAEAKISALKAKIDKAKKSLNNLPADEFLNVRRVAQKENLWFKIKRWQEKIQRLNTRIQRLYEQIDSDQPSICFGSRRLFNAQFFLEENGFANHAAWREAWLRSRSAQFFVLGSKDENGGNQGCTITRNADETYDLRLRMPNHLVPKFGVYVTISGIKFGYQKDVLDQAILENQARNQRSSEFRQLKKQNQELKEAEFLANFGQAISYRFARDEKRGWRVLATTNLSQAPEILTNISNGAIGIDLNQHHFSVVEIDRFGCAVSARDIVFRDYDTTSAQNRTQICEAAKSIVQQALDSKKPIILEQLSFKAKKAGLLGHKQNASYNKMLSSLAYKMARDAILMQARKCGVEVIFVNPAFTSFIGKLKYSLQFNSDHQAAALVIARRGIGRKDRLPAVCTTRFKAGFRAFRPPEDGREDDPKSLKVAKKLYDTWFASQIKELRRQEKASRRQKPLVQRHLAFVLGASHQQPKRVRVAA